MLYKQNESNETKQRNENDTVVNPTDAYLIYSSYPDCKLLNQRIPWYWKSHKNITSTLIDSQPPLDEIICQIKWVLKRS